MNYCIDPNAQEPIFLINKHIGFDADSIDEHGNVIKGEGQGIDGAEFQRELLYVDSLGKSNIKVFINSFGGSVVDGYSICNSILKTKTPVDTYCVGAAASIAGVIFLTGRKRIMSDYGWLMFHNPHGGSDATLDTIRNGLIKLIEQKSGMTEKQVSEMLDRDTYISPSEALELKLCDSIETSSNENTKYLRGNTVTKNFYKECNKVLNSILNTNPIEMIKVTMKLGLNDSAPEDSIVKAIEAIENRATMAELELKNVQNKAKVKEDSDSEEMDKLKNKAKEAKEAYDKCMQDLEDCQNKLNAMETDKKKAEDDAKAEKVKNMIEGYAKAGRIKNEATVILKWTETAKKLGFEETKSMIEDLPLNKISPVNSQIELRKLEEGAIPTTAAGLAAKNRLKNQGK